MGSVTERHVGLVVQDLNSSVKFWTEVMGFKLATDEIEQGPGLDLALGIQNVRVHVVKMDLESGFRLELLKFDSHPDADFKKSSPSTTGLRHIAFTVENIFDTLGKIRDFGFGKGAEPQLSADGRVLMCYTTGPEGVLLELVQLTHE